MNLMLYGAGGHGKVVVDVVRCGGRFKIMGFLDDDLTKAESVVCGVTVFGGIEALVRMREDEGVGWAFVSVGRNASRLEIAERLRRLDLRLATLVHPRATVACDTTLGDGTVIMPGAVVNSGSSIGRNAIINTGAIVEHDCLLEDGVHIGPGANLGGGVAVGRAAQVGIGALVIQGIRVGSGSILGAGSVVIRDVAEGATIVGNPGRQLRQGSC